MKKIITILILIMMITVQCKKKKNTNGTNNPPIACTIDKTFEGKYVGVDFWQKDTITINFTEMSPNCKARYTLNKFYTASEKASCSVVDQVYHIEGNTITDLPSGEIWSNTWNDGQKINIDIGIRYIKSGGCTGLFNFRKIN